MIRSQNARLILQGSLFVLAAVAVYLLFRDGSLDEWGTSLFFDPDPENHWKMGNSLWVQIAYKGGSLITIIWAIGIFAAYLGSMKVNKLRQYRSLAIFCFLLLAIGPGLIVNAVCKDHWGRPRPRDTVAFGGTEAYQAPFVMSDRGGKSFPCGHCSVGFAFAVFGFWNRRRVRNSPLTLAAWIVAIFAGSYLGLARIAVGGHYISDVIAAALIVFFVIWVLDSWAPIVRWKLPKLSEIENLSRSGKQKSSSLGIIASGVVIVVFVLAAMLALPFRKDGTIVVSLANTVAPQSAVDLGNQEFQVICDKPMRWTGHTLLRIQAGKSIVINYRAEGFGWPWNRVEIKTLYQFDEKGNLPELHFKVKKTGVFSELNIELSEAPQDSLIDSSDH